MNKKVSLGLTISIAALSAAITFIITSFFSLQGFNEKMQAVEEKAEKYERLEALDDYVRNNYYTQLDEEDEEAVINGMLKGYVAGLGDVYSGYLTAEEYQAFLERESGQTVGVGVGVQLEEDGYMKVIEVQPDSPAEDAGILVGDRIVEVEELDVADLGFNEAVSRVKGEEGTDAHLVIERDGEEMDFAITRRPFDIVTVYSKLLDGNVGYVRVSGFRETTVGQFQEAVDQQIANGATSLIFDMRNNGGGLLTSLQQMLDPLLPEGTIATANYQGSYQIDVVSSDAQELNVPMVVLVNESTASAAELFSASLRDFKGAKLVGTTTYGKGVMQNTVQMDDGGALTLTVATYQTTRSDCYHGVGLVPDYEVQPGEHVDLLDIDPDNDPQLAKALELAKETE